MGARKKRQGFCWHEQPGLPVSPDACSASQSVDWNNNLLPGASTSSNFDTSPCSSCCNKYDNSGDSSITQKSSELNKIDNASKMKTHGEDGQRLSSNSVRSSSNNSFSHILRKYSHSLLSSRHFTKNNHLVQTLILLIVVASSNVVIRPVESVCVWQGGSGFRVACGFKQSGLFRLRSLGGIKGYLGGGFTIGDEQGFKDSLTNTEPQQTGGYVIPSTAHSQRSLPTDQGGLVGQFSHVQDYAVPFQTGDPALQQQQRLQYLHTIQHQMDMEHQNLQLQAADQQNQRMLEQQMYAQGVTMGPPTPVPTVKVKRAGGLTKRASLWNWPTIFGRGKNSNGKKKKGRQQEEFHGPPPPPQNRRGGPPVKPKPGKWPGRRSKNGPPPPGRNPKGPRIGPFPLSPVADSFISKMRNPFAHLQENFVGKPSGPDVRQMNHEHHPHGQQNFPGGHNPNFMPQHEPSPMESGMQQLPHQQMLPPPSGAMPNLPKFKKIPNNLKPKPKDDDYDDGTGVQNQQLHPPVDRMMTEVNDEQQPDFYGQNGGSLERQFSDVNSHDPAGLQMLKRTQNFGTVFHLVNPDGSPVNMQFERQPPPSFPYSSQQHPDDLIGGGSSLPNAASLLGAIDSDSPLATAVYDPNVFPDIYFTTTERQNQDPHAGGGAGGFALSQEFLDTPLLLGGANQIKRILGSSEKSGEIGTRRKVGAVKSIEISPAGDLVVTRRKMRRRKKLRVGQGDTLENLTTGIDASATATKKRRKGRRKKYKLQTKKMPLNAEMPSSTERMGLPAGGGEEASAEMRTESPTLTPLTTTPASLSMAALAAAISAENKVVKSDEKFLSSNPGKKQKTSFSLPSVEDAHPLSLEILSFGGPSSENTIDTSATTNRSSIEETTTKLPFSYSTFGYYDALKGGKDKDNIDDYDLSGPSGPGDFYRGGYDPRYPPDHEFNRGHNMTKFIRPRGPYSKGPTTPPTTTTSSPFIYFNMVGNRTQGRFSSKFHKGTSPFRLDTDVADEEMNRLGPAFNHNQHPFYTNSNYNKESQNDKGVYLKFDSHEWSPNGQQHGGSSHQYPDANHYNKTSLNSGYYGGSKEFRPSVEIPWSKQFHPTSTSAPVNHGGYGGGSTSIESKTKFMKPAGSSVSVEHGLFGPTMESFGPPRPTTTPVGESSGERRKLHKNLFGGSSADVSELGDWASPNFWGSGQDAGRYGPRSDFETTNNNLKRLLNFGDPNGLKEIQPGDLSSPTPMPVPSPSPSHNTMEDQGDSSPDYILSPSTPGRWGKQRRRKGKTTAATTTLAPVPFVMATASSILGSHSTTTTAPSKWMSIMSNEIDTPMEFYDNISPMGSHEPDLKRLNKGKKKSGIEIKFKSGEDRDPEEQEGTQNAPEPSGPDPHFDILGGFPGVSGFPGGMMPDFDTSQGFREPGRNNGPPQSEISYFPPVNSGNKKVLVQSGPPQQGDFPTGADFGPPNTKPVYHNPQTNNGRKEFTPSSEDLGPLPPTPPTPGRGLPYHNDNPFKLFEKQEAPKNGGFGFVSTKHELKDMESQIQKFASISEEFLRRDSSDVKMGGGHAPSMNGNRPDYSRPPSNNPSSSGLTVPGFPNIPLPSIDPSPADPVMNQNPHSPLDFGPSGFPNNLRDPQQLPDIPLPPSVESFPPTMSDESDVRNHAPPSPPPAGFSRGPPDHSHSHEGPWDFPPMDHNEIGPPPPHMHYGEHGPPGRPRPPSEQPPGRNRPPFDFDDEIRRPPLHDGPPPSHFRDGPPRPPPSFMKQLPPPKQRDDYPSRPPPPHYRGGEHDRPPQGGRHHDFPPRGPPPSHRDHDRRPPPEFERDFPPPPRGDGPPRHYPDERFRDGPPSRGPPPPHHHSNGPPSPPHRPQHPPGGHAFHAPPKDDSYRHDNDRRHFHDQGNHKTIETLRPPPRNQFHDKGFEQRGDHSSIGNWHDDKSHDMPRIPPTPQGMPDYLDLQKIPKDQRPPASHMGPFQQKNYPPPPPGGKKPMPPNGPGKIPPQVFKPPPPPKSKGGNIFTNLLTGFGKTNSNKPPPPPRHQHMPPPPPNSKFGKHPPPPQSVQNAPPKYSGPPPPNSDYKIPDKFSTIYHHDELPPRDLPKNTANNYINHFNDRYEPPAPQGPHPNNNKHHPLPPPVPHEHSGSQLPFLPFPGGPGSGSFESSFVDLDRDPHINLLPPSLAPVPHGDPSLPVRNIQGPPKPPPRPVYQPTTAKPKIDEKSRVLEAFETLNKANYDVIQSLAMDQYGTDFLDRIKTKTNMVKSGGVPQLTKPMFPPKMETPRTTTTPPPTPLMHVLNALATKKPAPGQDDSNLTELLKMINSKSSQTHIQVPSPVPHAQPVAAASTMMSKNPPASPPNPITNLLQTLTKPFTSPPPPPPTTTPELPSNPGLLSLTSTMNHASNTDIKSLQAQIAKAIIAKAHRKSENEDSPVQHATNKDTPLTVIQQLAQNRQYTTGQQDGKNYTASQIETLKKLIALNNIEQKLSDPHTTAASATDPLKKLQSLLPKALTGKPDQIPINTITRKMLDSSTANSVAHHHNNPMLQSPDPTILALKAIALSKAQGVNPQPSISLPQQVKPTEPSSQPIAVDLSAILSPSPPVVEMSGTKRLTNVRNAPKSFYPANATQGFEEFTLPLMTEFQCEQQSFFPGLYADTELGCRVFHLCAKTEAGYMMKSFRCPKETVFDQEVLRCNWNLFVDCPASRNKYHFNKYLSQSFQFLKILGEFSANIKKSDATMTG